MEQTDPNFKIPKTRLEAFSDGVIAIIITIMVLELKIPHGHDLNALLPLLPIFLSYVLSFIFVGIYWNNHHHMLAASHKINGAVLWANLHLLFWLSLIPFSTGFMGENHFEKLPVGIYGINLLMCAIAYTILAKILVALSPENSPLSIAFKQDRKGVISLVLYAIAIPFAFYIPVVSMVCFVSVALLWLIPDSRIEKLSK